MKDNVFCWDCNHMFLVEYDDYHEVEQEETFTVEYCPKCGKANSIEWRSSISFDTKEPSKEDLKNNDKEEINPEKKDE